jgi:YD repeat-containing protein
MKILALFFCFLPFYLSAQQLPNVIPPSPQTQELNKYIDFPVDLSTGVPEISIPLYTIKTKGVEIPITLNYHASGIKSGQDDGDVGLGWSLSCNYRVSRTIYGHTDTKDIAMSLSSYQSMVGSVAGSTLDKYLSRYVSEYPGSANPDLHMPPRSGGLLDGEYDQFNYLVPGQSGKFIISDRIAKTVSEFSPNTNKFGYIEGMAANNLASGIIGFSIKDASQNVFSFGEQVDQLGARVLETHHGSLNAKDVTAWALTDIDTKYGEKVKFLYNSRFAPAKYKLQKTMTVLEPRRPNTVIPGGTVGYELWEYTMDDMATGQDYSVFALSSIKTDNERVDFVQSSPPFSNKIKRINITDSTTNTLIKRIEFFYSEIFIFPSGYTFLDSVKIFDKDLLNYEKYSFDYYDKNLPSSTVLVPDQWGYNKFESDREKLLHQELGNDVGFPSGSEYNAARIAFLYQNSYSASSFADRKSNNSPTIFSLKSISYPTGGKTVYEYEGNRVDDGNAYWKYSGGIRVKEIRKYKDLTQYLNNDNEVVRFYTYGTTANATGKASYQPDHHDFRNERILHAPIPVVPGVEEDINTPRRWVIYSSNSFAEAAPITYYEQVTENFWNTGQNNGKIVYYHSDPYPISVNAYPIQIELPSLQDVHLDYQHIGPRYVSQYAEWRKPYLISKKYYRNDNTLAKKETYSYHENIGQIFTGLKVRPFARSKYNYSETYNDDRSYFGSYYKHGLYTITTGKNLLTEKSEVTYAGSDSLKVTTAYTYNNLDQVIKETTVDSKNQVIEKSTIYPTDTPYDYLSNRMLQANDVNKVLTETVTVNSGVVSQVTHQYNELSGEIFVPDKIKQYNTATQLQEDGIVFHKYDAKGNVLSLSKVNDLVISYIWSYGAKLPIAEIKGPDYQTIENMLGLSAIQEFSTRVKPTKTEIDTFLAPIRAAINAGTLKDVEISSFSYDPLLGIRSQTDTRGRSTYYEYDSFGRLSVIRDDNGAIVKKMDYNYRNH